VSRSHGFTAPGAQLHFACSARVLEFPAGNAATTVVSRVLAASVKAFVVLEFCGLRKRTTSVVPSASPSKSAHGCEESTGSKLAGTMFTSIGEPCSIVTFAGALSTGGGR
jgi:hypothetical protein